MLGIQMLEFLNCSCVAEAYSSSGLEPVPNWLLTDPPHPTSSQAVMARAGFCPRNCWLSYKMFLALQFLLPVIVAAGWIIVFYL